MKYKKVLKFTFYEMINIKDQYILFNADDYSKLNPTLMTKFLKTFFIINNPIIPHFTEYMYITYLNPIFERFDLKDKTIKFLCNSQFPDSSYTKLFKYKKYLNKVIQGIREASSKKGKGNKNVDMKDKNDIKIRVLFAKKYSSIQKEVLNILKKETYDENPLLI